jgi:hypothetical protein
LKASVNLLLPQRHSHKTAQKAQMMIDERPQISNEPFLTVSDRFCALCAFLWPLLSVLLVASFDKAVANLHDEQLNETPAQSSAIQSGWLH